MNNMFYGLGGVPDFRNPTQGPTGMGSSIPGLGEVLGGNAGGYDQIGPGGGMDVMGTLQAHGNAGTMFQRNAGAGPMNYGGG